MKLPSRPLTLTCGVLALVFVCASTASANCPGEQATRNGSLNMLVLGDSIMWGQGLKTEHKFWWRVKCWLEEKTGKEVKERIEAHSGAVIDQSSANRIPFMSNDGEVNLDFPTINEQVDHALEYYGERRDQVDLILVDGCINDVGVKNLLNPALTPEALQAGVNARCGTSMRDLLRRIVDKFPRAYVMVTGYYRIVSSDTADNTFLRMLVKNIHSDLPEIKKMDDREIRRRLITLSEMWFKLSTTILARAVIDVNEELASKNLPARARFVEIQFWPEHSFSASQTLLWNFVFGSTNLSGLRNLLVILSFGSDAYKPNDHVRSSREKSCKETFKAAKGIKETKAQKKLRKDKLLVCRYASLGHPNHMGALVFTEAIKGHLQSLIEQAGWKQPIASH